MRQDILSALRCPVCCIGELDLFAESRDNGQVTRGRLVCKECARGYPIEEGIARLLPPQLVEEEEESGPPILRSEIVSKKSEMAARDAQVKDYDAMKGLALFGRWEIPATLAKVNLGKDDILLEAGCGTGRMTATFASRCASHVAVDYSIESLRVCKSKLEAAGITNVDLIQADICSLPFVSGTFTKVVSCGVLEHIPTPHSRAQMVGEMSRSARPGADVVISAYEHSLFTRIFGQKEGEHAGGIYFFRFSRHELRELLATSLDVKSISGKLVYYFLAHCKTPAQPLRSA